jgi:GNAT superfamily N-acetyltransferase
MIIEKATTDDIPELCELLAELFNQEVEFAVNYAAQAKGLYAIITNPAVGMVLVARKQRKIIGMINMLLTISTALGSRVVILEDMVVLPNERGSGVGSRLLTAAIENAREQGCKRITLLTDSNNKLVHQFYEKHGFTQSQMLTFRLLLT